MSQPNILVVEDEPIVAKDIQRCLEQLGYGLATLVTSGEEAIRKATADHPDLILMDILLKGTLDGVETVKQIRRQSDVPVIYLTAFADDQTRERAMVTSPAGYMVKPYQPKELGTTIEQALYRAHEDRGSRPMPAGQAAESCQEGDAVMATDQEGCVVSLNPVAERLTGWRSAEARGMRVDTLIAFEWESSEEVTGNPALTAMARMQILRLRRPVILTKQGARRLIGGYVRPTFDDRGLVEGALVVLHMTDEGSSGRQEPLKTVVQRASSEEYGVSPDVICLCAWCKRIPDSSGQWRALQGDPAPGMPMHGGLCPDCMARCFPSAHG